MRMQRLYYEFDAEDRQVYTAWLRKTLAVLALILVYDEGREEPSG